MQKGTSKPVKVTLQLSSPHFCLRVRVWSLLTSSSKRRCLRRMASGSPSWPSRTRWRRSFRVTTSGSAPAIPTALSPWMSSGPSGTRWVTEAEVSTWGTGVTDFTMIGVFAHPRFHSVWIMQMSCLAHRKALWGTVQKWKTFMGRGEGNKKFYRAKTSRLVIVRLLSFRGQQGLLGRWPN